MNDLWFLDESAFNRFGATSAAPDVKIFSEDKIQEFRSNADKWVGENYAETNLVVDGTSAIIQVNGILLDSASRIDEYYARWFGEAYSTYSGIAAQIDAAEKNPYVEEIQFVFNTPGGLVAGGDNLAQIIAGCGKATKAVVGWMAASMGYYLASQCDTISATAPTSSVGSIGTIVSLTDTTKYYEQFGIKFYTISSTNAPRKAPEPHSEEFKREIQSRVDELAAIFVQRVSEGRTRALGREVNAEEVETNFGRGGLVIAKTALAVGMIDAVEEAINAKEDNMAGDAVITGFTQDQLDAACEEGVSKERARVASLLPFMGADSERVIKAIEDGEVLGADLFGELNAKAVAQARADALAEAKAEEEGAKEEEAESREDDAAPEVSGVDPTGEGEESSEAADEAIMALAVKKSNIKPQGGKQ